MRTVKRSAFLSGICGVAAALALTVSTAQALEFPSDLSAERPASILAFPKVLASEGSDTIITVGNTLNRMVHARCFYVDAQLPFGCEVENPLVGCTPRWQETDFEIWLTKQQPTHWRVSVGRFVNDFDGCFQGNKVNPALCENAGFDPGAIPPVQEGFVGELKCVQVDETGAPYPGNSLKGEATIKTGGDVAKYNAIGFQGTALVDPTSNTLLLNLPYGIEINDQVIEEINAQYSACPQTLIVNHFAEGVTDPVVYNNLRGGICEFQNGPQAAGNNHLAIPCVRDEDCLLLNGDLWEGQCIGAPQVQDLMSRELALRSATITDLTLIPCSEDFEEQEPTTVTFQFEIFNEFEDRFSASTTITCWKNFFLFQVDSPNDWRRSVFSYDTLGTTVAQTRITPVGGRKDKAPTTNYGLIGVQGTVRADRDQNIARTLTNLFIEGDRFTASGGAFHDEIIMSDQF